MARDIIPLSIISFLGENSSATPLELEQRQAQVRENLYRETNKLVRRKGSSPLSGSLSATELDGLHWFRIDETEYLFGYHGGDVVDFFTGATVSGGVGILTPGSPVEGAWLENRFYFSEGEHLWRFNGSNIALPMPARPASGSFLAVDGGAGGSVAAGTYYYRLTADSVDGFPSEPGEILGPTVVAAAGSKITITGIPTIAAGEQCSTVSLWRLDQGVTTDFHFVGSVANGTSGFSDTAGSTEVAANPELRTNTTRTPPGKFLVEHQGRLVTAGCLTASGNLRTVSISNYNEPYYTPDVPQVGNQDEPEATGDGTKATLQDPGERITGLASYGQYLAAFTAGAGYLIQGDSPNTFTVNKFVDHGCVAHRTIQSAANMILWLGADGVYAWQRTLAGNTLERISDDISEDILPLSASQMARAHAFVWDHKYFLAVPGAFEKVYDLRHREWSRVTGRSGVCSAVTVQTGEDRERIYAAASGAAQVWQFEVGATDNGTPITARWKSKELDMGLLGRLKRVYFTGAKFRPASGLVDFTLTRDGGEVIETYTHSLSGKVSGGNTSWIQRRMNEKARAELFALEISTETTAEHFEILATEIFWKPVS